MTNIPGRLPTIAPILFTLTLFFWLVTQGEWRLFDREGLSTYYDALGDSMLQGRLDVPRSAIAPEAFIRDGKFYGYFGFTPALLRIPLNFIYRGLWGQWTRLSMIVSCMLSLIVTDKLVILIRKRKEAIRDPNEWIWVGVFLLAAGSGSTMMFLAGQAFVYHEAILWGSTLSLVSVYYLLRYQTEGDLFLLILSGLTAFFAFSARPTGGAGAVLAIALVALFLVCKTALPSAFSQPLGPTTRLAGVPSAVKKHRPTIHALVAGSFVVITLASYLGINYLKFHSWNGVPLKYYFQYQQSPGRLALTGGSQFHLCNLATCFIAYFGRIGVCFRPEFPWIMCGHAVVYRGAIIDVNGRCSSVPASMPALFVMSCIGSWALIRADSLQIKWLRMPAISLGLGGAVIFFTVGICERYLHDLYPFLIITGIVGLNWVLNLRRPRFKNIALVIFIVLALVGTAINSSFGLAYQSGNWGL